MQPSRVRLLVAGLSLTSLAAAQDRVTLDAPSGASAPVFQASGDLRLPIADGPSQTHQLDDVSDDVPLPVPENGAAGAVGDALTTPAGGDPFFLGFAGGKYYPPVGENVDPLLVERAGAAYDAARPSEDTYAFVMFAQRITAERRALLEQQGARILGFHPHYTLRVALPPTSIEAVAALDFVRWIGTPRDEQKLHPHLVQALTASPNALHDIHVNVYDSDLGPSAVYVPLGSAQEGAPEGVAQSLRPRCGGFPYGGHPSDSVSARGSGSRAPDEKIWRIEAH